MTCSQSGTDCASTPPLAIGPRRLRKVQVTKHIRTSQHEFGPSRPHRCVETVAQTRRQTLGFSLASPTKLLHSVGICNQSLIGSSVCTSRGQIRRSFRAVAGGFPQVRSSR